MKIDNLKKTLKQYFMDNNQYYKALGYKIRYEKDIFKISYNDSNEYILNIETECNEEYLILTPYNKSYFKTLFSLNEIKSKVNMVLLALKENEELYINHENE